MTKDTQHLFAVLWLALFMSACGGEKSTPITQKDPCSVQSITAVAPGAGAQWSHTGNNLIAFHIQDSSGIYQVHVMKPDGSGDQCLTCSAVTGAPPATVHKGSPDWHASGKYILFQAEMTTHVGTSALATPGAGWWNNVWVMTSDAMQFFQLTNYNPNGASGVLVPRFSRDGSKVFWSELICGPTGCSVPSGPFGAWQLHTADFVISGGTPSLANIQTFRPSMGSKTGIFYESQDWSPDGNEVLFAADIGLPSPFVMDVFKMDLTTQNVTDLTNTSDQNEEQATFSNSGNKIVLMSSRNTPGLDPTSLSTYLATLRTEDFLINPDGTNWAQITHFNTAGYPEYTGQQSAATKASWGPDGTQLIAEQQVTGSAASTAAVRNKLWLMTFAGACGAQ